MRVRTRPAGRRLALVDRPGQTLSVAFVIGPVEVPAADDLRTALRRFAAVRPEHPFFRLVDTSSGRWLPLERGALDAHCAELVVEGVSPAGDPGRVATAALGVDRGSRPGLLLLGRDTVTVVFTHALGDAASVNGLTAELLVAAVENRAPLAPTRGLTRLALPRALGRLYGRHPRLVADLVASNRPRPDAGAERSPAAPSPRRVVAARSEPGFLAELRERRRAAGFDASTAAVVFAASARRVADAGLLEPRTLSVLVDCRRYLPPGAAVEGNFATAITLAPADPGSPEAVAAELQAAIAVGRPLAALALGGIRAGHTAPRPAAPTLAVNHLGGLCSCESVPWRGDPSGWRYVNGSTALNPGELSLGFHGLGGALHVAASFDPSRFRPETVAAVVDDLCSEPGGLLESPRGRRRALACSPR